MKIFLIYNTVYLPIEKDYNDESEQKYISSGISGRISMNQIYTESELRSKYQFNPEFKECKDLLELFEKFR